MRLDQIIAACGGQENIRRVLRIDNSVVLELVNTDINMSEVNRLPFNAALSQITWQPESPLTEEEWCRLGKMIELTQRNLIAAIKGVEDSVHRPLWHHAPKQGLINDPNGFIFHQGDYHLFYGLDPFVTGDKNRFWVHYVSRDLVNWIELPIALCPSDWFDCHGVYSGHAVSTANELMVFYTGNVRVGEKQDRVTTQCLAISTDGVNFKKYGPIISELPPNVTAHCRDPKLVRNGDHWLMLLGAQEESVNGELHGRLAMYRSVDLYHWSFVDIFGDDMGDFGYMWECPDFVEVDGQSICIFCPQGISSDSEFRQIPHHSVYVTASLDADDQLSLAHFSELDYGFDFYASQTTRAADGRQLLIGWMGMPGEVNQPSMQDNWLHQLTCPRELSWENGKLYQNPIRELNVLRGEQYQFECKPLVLQNYLDLHQKSFELHACFSWPECGRVTLRLLDNGEYYCAFIMDADNKRILLDRRHALPTDGETMREIPWPDALDIDLQVLADTSSLELFINHGEYVMTARIFTPEDATKVRLISETSYYWPLVTYWLLDTPLLCVS